MPSSGSDGAVASISPATLTARLNWLARVLPIRASMAPAKADMIIAPM